MISSEVQRTLVKSAPELWAEVSDPAALARHLGELGDIRITRIEPEQKVEWEVCNSDTSGTVVIKPSGWGTKVKLTVTRETTEDEKPSASEDELHAESEATSDPVPSPIAEATPIAPPSPEPGHVATEPFPSAETSPTAEPVPSVEAELELLAEDPPGHFPTSEPQEPQQPEPVEEPEHFDMAATIDASIAAKPDVEPDPDPDRKPALELVPAPEQEPRRGFFARLFGRFRVETSVEHKPPDDGAHADEPIEHSPTIDGATELHEQVGHAETTPGPPDAHAAWAAWAEPAEPATPVEPEPAPPIEPVSAPTTSFEQQFEATLAPTDISAEIKAAEEVAAEEVTAVLTGVLDRLGAAHHRPFSRA
jgi:hypothetical protein